MIIRPATPTRARLLTLTDLLTELARYGYDPDTVTFATTFGPVTTWNDDLDINREDGTLVVTLGPTHSW